MTNRHFWRLHRAAEEVLDDASPAGDSKYHRVSIELLDKLRDAINDLKKADSGE